MRWTFAKGEVEAPREIEGVSIESVAESHRSPGLQAALSHIHEDRPCNILDLGPAATQNVEFFSRFRCRLCIADLLGQLADEPASAERLESTPEAFFHELLPIGQRPFDLVLAWTVFDHLDRDTARHLARRLAQLTNAGAPLFAIIATGHDPKATGHTFTICQQDTLEYRPAERPRHHSVPFNPAAFAQLLAGFAIDYSVFLRHGFQEYVAVRLQGPA